jgi:hypothetical protein
MGFAAAAWLLHIFCLVFVSQSYVIDESYTAQIKYPHAFREVEDAMYELNSAVEIALKEVTGESDRYDNTRGAMFGEKEQNLEEAQGMCNPNRT